MAGRFVGGKFAAVREPPPTEPAPGPLLAAGGEELLAAGRSGGPGGLLLGAEEDGGVGHVDVGLDGKEAGEGLAAQLAGILLILLVLWPQRKKTAKS